MGCNSYSQIHFDGLLHEPVGNVDIEFIEDSLSLINNNPNEVSGIDIVLGATKGFGFSFTAIDPILNPNGAYQEWRMIGTLNGIENQELWKERHQVNNQDGLIRTDVFFDTSPLNPEANGLRIFKNNELVYESTAEIGLIYTVEVDTSIVSAAAICKPRIITALWDATCFKIPPPILYPYSISIPDGTRIDLDIHDLVKFETYAIAAANPPSSCSKVESRSQNIEQSLFHNEGIVMFEDRVPFYAIGDIIYETNSEFLKIHGIDNSGAKGVNISLENTTKFDLNWMPIIEFGENYSIEISSKGIVDQEEQALGYVKHELNPNGQFLISADFSDFDTGSKTIQILDDENLIQEFSDFNESEIAFLERIPSGCGKLDQIIYDPFDFTLCYYMKFDDLTDFVILGEIYQGDEIRILSNTEVPVNGLSGFTVLLSDVNEFTITEAKRSIPTSVNQFSRSDEFIDIYPNPVTNELDLSKLEDIVGFNYVIFDNNGKVAKTGPLDNRFIDVSLLNQGMFYLKLFSSTKVFRSKFLKIE